jgi:hypothetical protein
MKKTLTKASSKKSSRKKTPGFPLRTPSWLKSSTGRTPKPIKFVTKKNGELETKEEREKRLAKRAALTLRAFQMAYDNYHRK